MLSCIIIQNDSYNEINIKNINEENIYKKCNFKNNNNFKKIKSWINENDIIELWGKDKGLSNSENNNIIFKKLNIDINIYGRAICILKNENTYKSLNIKTFNNYFKFDNQDSIKFEKSNNEENEENKENEENEEYEDDYDNNEENEILKEEILNEELTYDVYEYSDDE